MNRFCCLLLLSSALGLALQTSSGNEDADYRSGMKAIDAHQWDRAIASFTSSAARKGSSADGALYWKAYAQNRGGDDSDALATVNALQQQFPKSRWTGDAQALALEIHGRNGAPVSPDAESNDDLKMLALNSLMQSDPARGLPLLQKVLASSNPPQVKERALFVLTQASSPAAHKLLGDVARNGSNPNLQRKAIQYIGTMGGTETRQELASIYRGSTDEDVKRTILRSLMTAGSKDLLLNLAKTESNPSLRHQAIQQLALTGGQEELWQLYQASGSIEDKEQILKSMFLTGNSDRLLEVARSEKDAQLRSAAIKSLGLMGNRGGADTLASIYKSDTNAEVRSAILNALFLQQNGKALVELARGEKDPERRKEIVKKMSLVHSPEVSSYMEELLR